MDNPSLTYGSFELNFDESGTTWYLAVHPEMYPAKQGIKPSGNYFIDCIHPERESCTFTIEQDESCNWFSERQPPFISQEFIEWVGKEIEVRSL